MEISFVGKRALVTGAAQGIGLAIVKKLVACGAQVVALDVQEEKLKEVVKQLPGVEPMVVDLSNWDSTEKALKNVGSVQLVVNNAGVYCGAMIQDMEEDAVNRMLDVNLKAIMAVCKHLVNEWSATGTQGAIVNIASDAAMRPFPFCPVYCATKAGVLQYTRCLALEYAPKGIRANVISPGLVNTTMTRRDVQEADQDEVANRMVPMKDKWMDPEDIANAAAFLLCDKLARRITGANLVVDAGMMLT